MSVKRMFTEMEQIWVSEEEKQTQEWDKLQ